MRIPPESLLGPGRGYSIRGLGILKTVRGQLIFSRWPRRQQTARTAAEAANRKLLAYVAQIPPVMDPYQQNFARDVALTTQLAVRDLLFMSLYGRQGYLVRLDGKKVYSMAAYQDVSATLDAIWQLKGGILVRGDSLWQGLPTGQPGDILTLDGDAFPSWAPGGGGGGGAGEWWMQPGPLKPTDAVAVSPDTLIVNPIIPNTAVTLTGLKFPLVSNLGSWQTVAVIYSDNGNTPVGGALLGSSPATTLSPGFPELPFTAPITLAPDTVYWIGLTLTGGSLNFQLMASDLVRNDYHYFSLPSGIPPATFPAATRGTGATQFTWYGY